MRSFLTTLLAGALFSTIALADPEKVIREGSFECEYQDYNIGAEFRCRVDFPDPFGDEPAVSIEYSVQPRQHGIREDIKRVEVEYQTYRNFGIVVALYHDGPVGGTEPSNFIGGVVKGTWKAIGPPITTVRPKYLALTVIYAAPGGNGGKALNAVSFQSGTTRGTSISITKSLKSGTTSSVDLTDGGPLGSSTGVSFEASLNSATTESLDVKHSFTKNTSFPAPPKDGIDHDWDQIVIVVKPRVDVSMSGEKVVWKLVPEKDPLVITLYVGNLNGNIPDPEEDRILLASGITAVERCEILKRDPLAKGGTNCQQPEKSPEELHDRYVFLESFEYKRPLTNNSSPNSVGYVWSDSSLSTVERSMEESYTVGVTMSASAGEKFVAKLSNKNTWQWTTKYTKSTSVSTSTSATANITGPSSGYSGPRYMDVYWDAIYSTFAFISREHVKVALTGIVRMTGNKPAPAMTEVHLFELSQFPAGATNPKVLVRGPDHRAFTDADGKFVFLGDMKGPVEIYVGGGASRIVQIPGDPQNKPIELTVQ